MERSILPKSVPRETFRAAEDLYHKNRALMNSYIDRLLWWNKKINLVSRSIQRPELTDHIVHSLIPLCMEEVSLENRILDCGTGGGLPGIVIAICNPSCQVMLNDISTKKIMALKDIVRNLKTDNISFVAGDINKIEINKPVTVVSKHAFKIDFLLLALRKINAKKIFLYKGSEVVKELKSLNRKTGIQLYDLSGSENKFYKGKMIVLITQ